MADIGCCMKIGVGSVLGLIAGIDMMLIDSAQMWFDSGVADYWMPALAANTGIVALSSNDYLIDWFDHILESYESRVVSIVI